MQKKCCCCSSVARLFTVMAVILICIDAKPDPRADHQVGDVWPPNVMIMTSNVKHREDTPAPKVFEPAGEVSVSTPDVIFTPTSDDDAVTESIQTDAVDAQLASPVDAIKADDVITESVPTTDEPILPFIADVKSTATLDDIIIPSVIQSDDAGVGVNSTAEIRAAADQIGNCVFNLAIPNRNIPSVTYSTNCDFCNHALYTVTCIPNAFACASLCAGDRHCSHFTYVANLLGGTCRLKSAPGSGGSWASRIQAPSPYVCGYIGRRAFQNVLLGLCLALEINVNIE